MFTNLSVKKMTFEEKKKQFTIFSFHIFLEEILSLSVVPENLEQLMSCRHRGPTRCVYRPVGGQRGGVNQERGERK